MSKVVETINTKVTKDGASKATVLTVDFADCSPEAIKAYAMQAIKVKVQGKFRQDGIPNSYTFKVSEHPVGARMLSKPTVESTLAAAQTMSKEERMALLKQLMEESQEREEQDEAAEQE